MAESVNEFPTEITVTTETEKESSSSASPAQDMELQSANTSPADAGGSENGNTEPNNSKRQREEGDEPEKEKNGVEKKQKVDEKSVEEQRLEEKQVTEAVDGGEKEKVPPVSVGPKSFGSSVEMFDYFYKLLHFWTPNLNLNKYEHLMLVDLLKKGHLEPEKKIGKGIHAFQVRYHPQFKSRCFFLIREDESVDDFSFRKCVDHILPLPENMQVKRDVDKALGGGKFGGGGRGGGRGRGRGGWRGGKSRN
ncbi:hypothetical protein LguiB_007900 [Lonicera macranthoides]